MSNMFIWGCSAGYLLKLISSKALGQSFTNKPWQYPKFMLISGILCTYWDWTRRIYLEDICLMEDRLEFKKDENKMNLLENGEELSSPFIDQFTQAGLGPYKQKKN